MNDTSTAIALPTIPAPPPRLLRRCDLPPMMRREAVHGKWKKTTLKRAWMCRELIYEVAAAGSVPVFDRDTGTVAPLSPVEPWAPAISELLKLLRARGESTVIVIVRAHETDFMTMIRLPTPPKVPAAPPPKAPKPPTLRERGLISWHGRVRPIKTIAYKGEVATLSAWAKRLGVTRALIASRLSYGWTVERALEEPPHPPRGRHGRRNAA